MATEIRNALDNVISTVEGITTSTTYANTNSFIHAEGAYTEEDIDTARGNARLFLVTLTGDSNPEGPLGQLSEPMDSVETVDVTIIYPMGRNGWELMRVVAEDHSLIRHNLMLSSKWDGANTGIMRRSVSGYTIDIADGEDGSSAAVIIPVRFRYRPTFT